MGRIINNQNFNTEYDFKGAFCGSTDIDIIGDLTDDKAVCVLSIWHGQGYLNHQFAVAIDIHADLDDALAAFTAYAKSKGWTDYFIEKDYDNLGRPEQAVWDTVEEWVDNHKTIDTYSRKVFNDYINFDPDDFSTGIEFLDPEQVYKLIDLLAFDDIDSRFKIADAMEKIIDYIKECKGYNDYFENENIYVDETTYIIGENFEDAFMSLDEFVEHIKDRQVA